MNRQRRPSNVLALFVSAWCGVLQPSLAPSRLAAQAVKPPAPSATASAEIDGGWPRDFVAPSGAVFRVFQPQIASWNAQQQLVAYAAISYVPTPSAQPMLGTVKLEADTQVALNERVVKFSRVKLTESHFGSASKEQVREIVATIEQVLPTTEPLIALDRVLARLDKSQIIPRNVAGVKADPPEIFYSASPAILVNIDSDVVWSPIKGNDLSFAVNTNWDLFEHGPTRTFFLRNGDSWLTASDIKGPWKAAGKLPDSFAKLPFDENWFEVKGALPGRTAAAPPTVFVSTKPAELILLQGPPAYRAVSGTRLLWVSNTESDVFRLGKTGAVYFLVSGRWFSAPDFGGPWTFATPTLPEDFKKISAEHERSRVLASVPGTDEAAEAVLLAQVPQTARVSKKQVQAPDVQYEGTPQYEPIEQTSVSRAVNTDKDIIKVGDLYYMCFQGVWFVGRSATGPWEVTGSVPNQIYEIPASSPSFNVTNVTVVEDDDDDVVFATTAAYTGLMIGWGCAVWGSGYYYPPYIGYGGYYPIYHPYYPTYGYHASYNPWTGTYGRGVAAYGPYGGAGVGARYNPRTGTYARGAAAYGPGGARGYAEAYNPRTGAVGATRQGSGVYGSWGQTGVRRGDQWATTSRVTNNRGTTTRVTQGSGGGAAATRTGGPAGNSGVARTASGDVYAGRDGNVYRKQDGGWQQYNGNGGWDSVQTPQPRDQSQTRTGSGRATTADPATVGQLDRDSAARADGAQRTRDAGSPTTRTTGGSTYRPSGGSSRPSGGGMRSAPRGGGRRR